MGIDEFVRCVVLFTFAALPLAALLQIAFKRVPWLFVGLAAGLAVPFVVTPDYYVATIWEQEPWRYYAEIWGPIAGLFVGLVIDVWIGLRAVGKRMGTDEKKDAAA